MYGLGNGYPAAIVRVADTTYLALSPICPHQGYYVDVDAKTGGFNCPGHHATFSARGAWTGGQVTTSLQVLVSSYDAAKGTVTMTIP